MIKLTIQIVSLCFVLFLSSCTKQEQPLTESQKEQNAIAELKKIVGNNGTITVSNSNSSNLLTNNSSFSIPDTTRPVSLTLEQFKEIYIALNAGKLWKDTIVIMAKSDSASTNKAFNVYDGGPIQKSGYHKVQFSPSIPSLGYFGPNSSLFSYLNVEYFSDQHGLVVGSPSLYFSGLSIFSWSQTNLSPIQTQFNYNQQTGNSVFTITGKASFGLQVAGLNWISPMAYSISVDVDGTVTITSGVGGLK